MKQLILFTFFLILISTSVQAQDRIFLKGGKMAEVHITEVGVAEVKYTIPEAKRQIIYTVAKLDIERIVFEDGAIMVIVDELENPDIYSDNRKTALKLDFISPLVGHTVLTLENGVRPGFSWEVSANFIGIGKNLNYRDAAGFGVRIGPKFIYTPDFKVTGMRYMHVLQGVYVRPELVFGVYKDNYAYEEYRNGGFRSIEEEANVSYGILFINLGKQWVFQNMFLVGWVTVWQKAPLNITSLTILDTSDQQSQWRLQLPEDFVLGFY